MSELSEVLEKVRHKLQEKKGGEFITRYCLAPSCGILLDDPTQFTCGHPQCNRELLEIVNAETELRNSVDNLLEKYDIPDLKKLENYIDELQYSVNDFQAELKAESMEEALKKMKKIRNLIKEIKKEL